MKIVIAGASGFIGKYLSGQFASGGHEVITISRSSESSNWLPESLLSVLDGAAVLINLSGRSINCRYNRKNKTDILSSRLVSTRLLSDAVSKCKNPPELWINTSATGIYSHATSEPHDESSEEFANDFLSNVVQQWENTFFKTLHPTTRKVALRFSVVLGKNGGAIQPLAMLTRFGLGGKQGTGKQMFSWIHIHDLYRMIDFIIENKNIDGVVNCTSPQPVTNTLLMKSMREKLGAKIGLPAPAFLVRIGTFIIGTDPNLVLDSTRAIPAKISDAGFEFMYSNINDALNNLF